MIESAGKPSFESLRDSLAAAPPAPTASERTIRWVDEERSLAFSRDPEGKLELFLVGAPLKAQHPSVRERLVHDTWLDSSGETVPANRFYLPRGGHFDAAAATILIELLDNGYPNDNASGLQRTEQLIALILSASSSENAVLTGLAGELLTLVALLRTKGALPPETLLDAWQGWRRSSRDFQFGSVGVEVKTSTTTVSRHHIQGWYQVEPGVSANGNVETQFFLLSLGLRWLPHGSRGPTIEWLAKEVLSSLPQQRREEFLDNVRNYGDRTLELDPTGSATRRALRRPFSRTFERLYDMSDERIRVLRSSDLAAYTHVDPDSVAFEINLPERVRGDRNPLVGFASIAPVIVAAFGL